MDKSVTLADDAENKSFKAKVVIDASMYTGVVNKIVAQLDTTGKCPTVNDDGTVNVTSAESENSLLCSAPDNYGTSYYYRGNVTNNYVKFANFYWRIVRINGDGSIRMIYDGTPGSSTYEETHANINDSTIKKYIDAWYEKNLKDTSYEQYLHDNIFCNDHSFAANNSGTGASKSIIYYRWYNFAKSDYNNKMMFKCLQQNDAFTVNGNHIGNGNLKYEVGLITADELVLAGGWNLNNSNYYLYTGQNSCTISPSDYALYGIIGHHIYLNGSAGFNTHSDRKYGVQPIINLKPNSLKSGDGTINNPYTVTTE